jgi:hemoglobin
MIMKSLNDWLKCVTPFCIRGTGALMIAAGIILSGCGSPGSEKKDDFFTSGSREADQRATQRMAKAEQLEDSGDRARRSGDADDPMGGAEQVEGKVSLYDRLGGEEGLTRLVDDFIPRLLQDPRVNWQREGVQKRGLLRTGPAVEWEPTPENVNRLKKHMVQFLSLATGGPARYEGKEMTSAHAEMRITNAEFDAAVGDIKASLDRLKYPNQEQKELLSIIESTRPQIVTAR